jgi:hypothetical protein
VRDGDRFEAHVVEAVVAHLLGRPDEGVLERRRAGDAIAVQIDQLGEALPRHVGRLHGGGVDPARDRRQRGRVDRRRRRLAERAARASPAHHQHDGGGDGVAREPHR